MVIGLVKGAESLVLTLAVEHPLVFGTQFGLHFYKIVTETHCQWRGCYLFVFALK